MTMHFLRNLRHSLFGNVTTPKPRKRQVYRRKLAMESLEQRQLLSITTLQNLSASENTGEKPQSKVFEYAGQWWTVMPVSSGTWVHRLDGTRWTPAQQITTNKSVHADVKLVGDVAHVLLFDGTSSQLASLQYDAADNRFEPWSLRPQIVNVPLTSGVETATIEVDSTGRMWVASDVKSTVEVRYSDGVYSTFSAPITVASGINSDDISAIVAMPGNKIGVMWSNQSTDRFGFKVHQDGAAPNVWSADEVPASQSALSVGGGMADDHLHLATASDGTVYAAVKTSYDKSGYAKIALLVRRPNGRWDNLYTVDTGGTRPIVVVNEAAGKLMVAYTTNEGGGDIVYKESPLGNIALSARKVLIPGSVNNVTSTKYTSTDEIVFLASSKGVLFSFDTATAPVNQAPIVNAGPDRAIELIASAVLDGTVTDDGRPTPSGLTTSWTRVSGPGTVTFTNSSAVDTTASFSLPGTYVLRLTASDGQYTVFDEMTVTVAAPSVPVNLPPQVSAGPDRAIVLGSSAALDGNVTDDGLPAPASITTTWARVSGPGAVSFANSSAIDTTASFSVAGTYVLRLTANDGQLSSSDDVTVTVSQSPSNPPPASTGPTQISFQNGLFPNISYAGTLDTRIASGSANTNYGNATTLDIDGSPDVAGLVKWDISAIPTGSIVVSAAIELNVTNSSSHSYELYALHRAWDELSATWQQFASGQAWTGPGANGSGDHGTAALGVLGPASKGIYRIALNDAGLAAVQGWINDPAANYGFIFKDYTTSDGVDFSTSEASTASQRPKLLINYEPAGGSGGTGSSSSTAANLLNAGSVPLSVSAGPDRTAARDQAIQLTGIVSGGNSNVAILSILWSKVSGPGTVTFGDESSASTTATFNAAGSYTLRLSVDDGLESVFDELIVTVT
jgi:hypothetical protein